MLKRIADVYKGLCTSLSSPESSQDVCSGLNSLAPFSGLTTVSTVFWDVHCSDIYECNTGTDDLK